VAIPSQHCSRFCLPRVIWNYRPPVYEAPPQGFSLPGLFETTDLLYTRLYQKDLACQGYFGTTHLLYMRLHHRDLVCHGYLELQTSCMRGFTKGVWPARVIWNYRPPV